MKELELNVTGIECMGCENRINNAVASIKGVKKVVASHENGKVYITLKKELTEELKNVIILCIENMGFKIEM